MKEYLPIIQNSSLFQNMGEDEIKAVMDCLSARTAEYKKGASIFRAGDITSEMGMVLIGSVTLVKEDYWGNRSILDKNEAGEVFGEVYACIGSEPLLVSVTAAGDCLILFLNIKRVVNICSNTCRFHTQLVQNLLREIAGKTFLLTRKLQHTSKRTTREKLLSYLSEAALSAGSSSFDIPFNRQELADYLYVDRSAMSCQLSRMKEEGILDYNKNHFHLFTHRADHTDYYERGCFNISAIANSTKK